MRALILRISIIVAAGLAGITIASMLAFQFERGADARRETSACRRRSKSRRLQISSKSRRPARLPTVLRALNTGVQHVEVSDTPPPQGDSRPIPGNSMFLGAYSRALGEGRCKR